MLSLNEEGRLDFHVYNEATAFARSSEERTRVVARANQWERAVKQGRFLPVGLLQDDSFVLRVATGDLRPQETEEWVGRLAGVLDLPDGVLVVAAGLGFL